VQTQLGYEATTGTGLEELRDVHEKFLPGVGWRGRIRTFDLLIQSQLPESGLAAVV
jgi:hypothetical protein